METPCVEYQHINIKVLVAAHTNKYMTCSNVAYSTTDLY